MPTFLMGKDAKVYQGTAGAQLASLTEVSNVKDVTLNLGAGEADVTTRANGGWKGTAASLKECAVEFEMPAKVGDTGLAAVRDAYLAGSQIRLAVLTGDRETAGSEGPMGEFSIVGFNRKEPLEEGVMYEVSAKLTVFDQWVQV